jgi:hypothetical protein
MIERAAEDPLVQSAALVAYRFKMDPVAVLKSSWLEWAIRLAASQYIGEVEAEADKKSKAQQGATGPNVPSWIG